MDPIFIKNRRARIGQQKWKKKKKKKKHIVNISVSILKDEIFTRYNPTQIYTHAFLFRDIISRLVTEDARIFVVQRTIYIIYFPPRPPRLVYD